MSILLKIVKGAGEGQSLTVPDGKTLTLGRGTDASYMIPDPLLSREHCALRCGSDGCVVTDLKSLNGTFLNGKRLAETRLLVTGDRVRLGSHVLEVLEASAGDLGKIVVEPEPELAMPQTILVPAPAPSPVPVTPSPPPPPSGFPPPRGAPPPPPAFPETIVVQPPSSFPARADVRADAPRTCESCEAPLAPDEERTMCPACFDRFDVKEDLLEGFRILERVFRTPTGTVYKAEQPLLGRTVLVKTITTKGWEQDETTIRRFLREAKAAARLTHPSIVEFFDVNEQGEHLFIVMEHVDGPTLEALVTKSGPLEPRRVVRYMAHIADALAFVHGHRVVHRDVRPGTILVGRPEDRAKLADFTLARNVEIAAFGEITATGDTLAGIPYFESPEQVRDSKRADTRSDIYSYGATFFFALSGRRPIGGANYIEFLSRLAVESAPPLESVASEVPPALAQVVNRCLRRDPDGRFQTMEDVAAVVVPIAQEMGIDDTTIRTAL